MLKRSLGIACGLMCSLAVAEPFVYQGNLDHSGAAASGIFDFEISLHDDSNGAGQIGSVLSFEDVHVDEGLFQLELDFGDSFDGSDRWLKIRVREGASAGGFTELLPLTKIGVEPQAHHAKVADTVLENQWDEAPGILWYGNGEDTVLINRSTTITNAERFGVHSNTGGFVGMYMSGPAGAFPFYGFSVDGGADAYIYYDESTGVLAINKESQVPVLIDSANNLVVNEKLVAAEIEYDTDELRTIAVSGDSFAGGVGEYSVSVGVGGLSARFNGPGPFTAPIQLPDGAEIVSMDVYANDTTVTESGYLFVTLNRRFHGGDVRENVCTASTDGFFGTGLVISDNAPVSSIVNNDLFHYHLRAYSGLWPGTNDLVLKSVKIKYRVSKPD